MPSDQPPPAARTPPRVVLRMGADGMPMDDVPHYSADQTHLHSYTQASEALSHFEAPILFNRADPHSHLIVALMDGTGNDVEQDPIHATNVAKFREQIRDLKIDGVNRIHAEYTAGPGTQSNPLARTLDGALGRTSLERAELAYAKLVTQAQTIFEADPAARLSLHLEGFSRGASQVPLLARMIDEFGIPDIESAGVVRGADGELRTNYTRYHQPPGLTRMSVGLYDPVPTGYMELMDRRLPPSVVSGFQISAAHERRGLFPSDQILPQGMSADGRFLHVSVAGAHSDIGGSYLRDGLGVRSLNLMTDYHNALLSEPLLQRVHEPQDPRLNVVHHSERGSLLFRLAPKVERAALAGQIHQLVTDPSRHSPPGEVVDLPVQRPAPITAEMEQASSTRQVARQSAPAAALANDGEALVEGLRSKGFDMHPYQAPSLDRPGVRMAGTLGALGVAASLYDAHHTAQRVGLLYGQSNPDAAQSELNQYMGRGLGGWSGGAAAGAAAGSATGPGVLVFIAYGALAGGTVGEKLAERWDKYRIFNLTDRDQVAWSFGGSQWTREELADLSGSGGSSGTGNTDTAGAAHEPRLQRFSALPEKASELNYLASNRAAALAIGDAPQPMDPYSLPATEADRASLRPANWQQDPQTSQWSRQVAAGYMEKGIPYYEREYASAQRATELDRLSAQVMDANVAQSSAAIAARYEAVYTAQNWQRHGEMPPAIQSALDGDALVASSGRQYLRITDGVWHEGGRPAEGNLLHELEATYGVLQQALVEHRTQIAAIEPPAPLTAREQERADLAATYLQHGVQPFPATLDAALDAVEKTRAEYGIAAGSTSLALEPHWDGRWDVDSPIALLQRVDGVVVKAAVTSTAELRESLLARGAMQPNAPAQDRPVAPELAADATAAPPLARGQDETTVASPILSHDGTQLHAESLRQNTPQYDVSHSLEEHALPETRERSVARPMTPMQSDHPDHMLHQQIRDGVAAMDAKHGRNFDDISERMTASLLVLAKEHGLTQADHVVLSNATADKRAGHTVFVVQGALDNPAHQRAAMPTEQAVQTSVEASLQQFDVVSQQAHQRTSNQQLEQQLQGEREQQDTLARAVGMR